MPLCTMSDTELPAENTNPVPDDDSAERERARAVPAPAGEVGGRESGLDPVRYGDWEKNGRCIDF